MKNILLISGSPRKGNTEFILSSIYKAVKGEKELILLRNKKIGYCSGCLYCEKHNACSINDGMREIYEKIRKADVIIIGTPNYFDNVTGILKVFMDRTNPFYNGGSTSELTGKKLVTIVVGGGKIKNSKRVGETALKYFSDAHDMELASQHYFKALGSKEVETNPRNKNAINKIIKKINTL